MSDKVKYQITVTETQAAVMRECLEACARMWHGQVSEGITELFQTHIWKNKLPTADIRETGDMLKRQLFPELHISASYGVGNQDVNPLSNVAWDLQTLIRHRLAWDRLAAEGKVKPEFHGVQYDRPSHYGSEPVGRIVRMTQEVTSNENPSG